MRYSRQDKFFEKSLDFKKGVSSSFKNKKIVIVGCGGVGSVFCELLVRGGFLNIVLVDNDIIDETNLQRQIFFEKDVGKLKSKSLAEYLKKVNSKVCVKVFNCALDETNIEKICDSCDLIVDCSDNFDVRYVINSYCENTGKTWIYNGAVKSEVMSCIFNGGDKLFSKVFSSKVCDERCCEVGVLASTTYLAGSLAYNQVLKYFLGNDWGVLVKIDLWNNKMFEVKIK